MCGKSELGSGRDLSMGLHSVPSENPVSSLDKNRHISHLPLAPSSLTLIVDIWAYPKHLEGTPVNTPTALNENSREEEVQQEVRGLATAKHGTTWKRAVLTIHDDEGLIDALIIRPSSEPHLEAPSGEHLSPR